MTRRLLVTLAILVLAGGCSAGCADQQQSQTMTADTTAGTVVPYDAGLAARAVTYMAAQPRQKNEGVIVALDTSNARWTALLERPDGSMIELRTLTQYISGLALLTSVGDYVTIKSTHGDVMDGTADVTIIQKDAVR